MEKFEIGCLFLGSVELCLGSILKQEKDRSITKSLGLPSEVIQSKNGSTTWQAVLAKINKMATISSLYSSS